LEVKGVFKGFDQGFDQTLTMVNQGVSLGIAGDVFELMTQVDLCLTKSTLVAGSLGLIIPTENLGRHTKG
jgi:hypothetical protein